MVASRLVNAGMVSTIKDIFSFPNYLKTIVFPWKFSGGFFAGEIKA